MAKKSYNASGESAESRALDRFAEMMIEKISEIQRDWQKPWFTPGAMKWPRNLSGREYNGQNALMLMLHCEKNGYKIPVFCTFNRVSGLNYVKGKYGLSSPAVDKDGERLPTVTVNKGEKSFPIFLTTYTVVHKDTKEKIKWEDFKKLGKEERDNYNVYPKSQVFNVFNIIYIVKPKEIKGNKGSEILPLFPNLSVFTMFIPDSVVICMGTILLLCL